MTNQRRILDDNAPENSRSEAQLLAVKIRRGGRRTCKKGTPQSKINLSFFTNAFETLGTRWRAGRLEVTGPDTRPVAACIHINVKQELSQVQAVP